MVFGYYHITLRTVQKGIIPEIDGLPNTRVSEKIKLGHIMFIPFIPLGKVWVMERAGQMYSMNHLAVQSLNKSLGRSKTPWYSFLGFILIPLIFIVYSAGNFIDDRQSAKRYKANFEKTLSANLEKVNKPVKSDIFLFKNKQGKKVGLQVAYSSADSVYFLAPLDNENKKWNNQKWAAGYFMSENPTTEVSFAKSDLQKTFKNTIDERMYNKGIPSGVKVPLDGLMQLDKVISISDKENLPVVSETETRKIRADFDHFIKEANNLDSLITLMDTESHQYYENILRQAKQNDKGMVEAYRRQKSTKNCLYEVMLYTKYVYMQNDRQTSTNFASPETKKDYLFFLKLLEKGFLTLDTKKLGEMNVTDVSIPQKDQAQLRLRATSNLLQRPTNVSFTVKMTKEDGHWKINMPSTYSYTENQIRYVNGGAKQWREMVRNNVSSVGEDVLIENAWFF